MYLGEYAKTYNIQKRKITQSIGIVTFRRIKHPSTFNVKFLSVSVSIRICVRVKIHCLIINNKFS